MAIILSGSDNHVHVLHEDSITHIAFERSPVEAGFPEFEQELPSVALWVEFYQASANLRLSAVGCECGTLFLSKIRLHTDDSHSPPELVKNWTINLGTSITCCRFFSTGSKHGKDEPVIHLLVTSALLPASVYKNVAEKGFEESFTLSGSEKYDVVTCGLVCDIHLDQKPSILLGT